jgi:biotin carboxyl carrier protein
MPGTVTRVEAAAGSVVEAGAPLVTLEAMKMEHTLRAPRAGTVRQVGVTVGSQVDAGAVLVVMGEERAP